MSERTLADWAEEYARMGYRVFPCVPGEKRPLTTHGCKDASSDLGEIAFWWEETPDANIGIATDGLLVVDIDQKGDEPNPWTIDQPDDLASTPVAKTPRGGFHHWFRQPANSDLRNSAGKLGKDVDHRANGGYVVAAPSVVDGQSYIWVRPLVPPGDLAEVPAWLLELLNPAPRQILSDRRELPYEIEERASKYIRECPEAVSGNRGHPAAYRVATYLVHGFCLSEDRATAIFKAEYNPRCTPEWSDKEIDHKIRDAAAKPHDRPYGWLRNAERPERSLVDLSNLCRPRIADDSRANDPGPFPEELLHVPGFISSVVEHNLMTAFRAQPTLALGAAIELQAVLAARKVRDQQGNRTNLYAIGVARSGAGKDHARKLNRKILAAADADKLEGPEELASDAGLFTAVHACPGVLFQFDEFGRFLKTIGDPKKAPHLFSILTVFMKLYSLADTSYKGKCYGDSTKNKSIEQPCVSIYGTTTPEHFYESLTAESLSDGFVARLLVFEGIEEPERQKVIAEDPPAEIVDAVRWWNEFKPGGNLAGAFPQPRVIESTPEAEAVFNTLAQKIDAESRKKQVGASLWARCEEKACRLAMIYACSVNRETPQIDAAAAEWACKVSEYVTRRMLWLAEQWVSDGYFDKMQKKIVRIIRDAGGRLERWRLGQRTRFLKSRERRELLENMTETGLIKVENVETDGRAAELIVLT